MSPELEQKLFTKFPLFYGDTTLSPTESRLPFGIECGDGWFDIIWTLTETIHNHQEWTQRVYPELEISIKAAQVKEKWGSLRVYTDLAYKDNPTREEWDKINRFSSTVNGMITLAESISSKTCEVCGGKGSLNKGPWFRVRCSHCDPEKTLPSEAQSQYGGMPSSPDQINSP